MPVRSRRFSMPMPFLTDASLAPLTRITSMRYYVLFLALAPLFMAFFGSQWWGMSEVWTVLPTGMVLFFVILGLVVLALIAGSITLFRSARRLPIDRSAQARARGRAWGRYFGIWFGIVFGLEIVVIAALNFILYNIHHAELLMPLMAIVVGVHFLPLGYVFRVWIYYITGSVVALTGVVVMLTIPVSRTIG